MTVNPRAFYDTHVIPNYEAWTADHSNRAKAMNAVSDAHNMAEYMYHHLLNYRPGLLRGARNAGEYRTYLSVSECADYQIIRDVADGHKHLELDRPSRIISSAQQVKSDAVRWSDLNNVMVSEMEFSWDQLREAFVVVLDSGERRLLRIAVDRVLAMWKRLLEDLAL